MKILMALDYYRPHVSGLTLYVEQLAEGLATRGHAVSRADHRHLPELPLESEENGVGVVRAPVLARVGKALVSPAILARALAELPALGRPAPPRPAGQRRARSRFSPRSLRVPIVVTYHCDLQRRPPAGPGARRGRSPAPRRTSRSSAPTAS